jgi:hypothetical protein
MFDEATHSRLRDAAPPKDLHGIPRRILRAPSAVHFQESDLAGEFRRLFLVRLRAMVMVIFARVQTMGLGNGQSKKDESLLTILHIWYVTFSSQLCTASARAAICASLARTTACELSGLPNALRCETHLRHSSRTMRCARADAQIITQRSWLKLLRITKIPPPSGPSVFSTGTRTLSKVTKAVPAAGE